MIAAVRSILLLLLALAATSVSAGARDLRIMTFNVRYPAQSDGPNIWENRRDLAARMIRRADPDAIGTQELFKRQGDDLVARLPGYRWIGVDRRGGSADEHMGIFYRADRLRVEQWGNFWLSDTPDRVGSVSWGHPLPRMVTWARFVDRTGRRFVMFNTHFPYRAEDEAAREKAAQLILRRIPAIAGDLPVVLTGDFNTTPERPAHAILTSVLNDAWDGKAAHGGPAETFHDFTGKADRRIDWLLSRGFTTRQVRTITEPAGKPQTSDHFPVLAVLRWPQG